MRKMQGMNLIAEERWEKIIEHARMRKVVRLDDLSGSLNVSLRTLRRDLDELERKGILRRTHGGAVWVGDAGWDLAMKDRASFCHEEKVRIGEAAARMVGNREAIILDAGTTVLEIARHLSGLLDLAVTTNAVNVAMELLGRPGITTMLVGGILRETTLSLVGPHAVEAFACINVDKAFIGTTGFTCEHGFMNSNPFECEVKKAMIKAAREVIVVADHSKLGKVSLSSFASLEDVDLLITDDRAPEGEVAKIKERGLEVVKVEGFCFGQGNKCHAAI